MHLHPHETDADLASEGATLPLPALGGATASLQAMVSGDNKPDLDHQGSTQGGADENLHQHTAECETEEPGPLPDDGVVRSQSAFPHGTTQLHSAAVGCRRCARG